MLLGLFFIAVGMSLNVGLVAQRPGLVLALVAGLIAIKFLVLFTLGRLTGLTQTSARSLAVTISQGGEFAFVIFGVAVAAQLLEPGLAELLIAVVTVSMAVTPLLSFLNDKMAGSSPEKRAAREFDAPPEKERHVIIAGFGRFGQIVARVLRAKKIPFTALEISPARIDFVRKYGNKIYYGDASRLALLHAARAGKAAAFVLAIDDVEASLRTAATVRKHFPKLTIYARARDRKHAHRLMDLGVTIMRRATLHSSLDLAGALLTGLGLTASEAEQAVETFRQHDEMLLFAHYWHHNDEEKMQALSKEGARELEELFEQDAAEEAAR
jgi:glutathione-regulated potassium-efflux system ancillary protein KefC/glutathione-regulated potassium-efflux system protein KefB